MAEESKTPGYQNSSVATPSYSAQSQGAYSGPERKECHCGPEAPCRKSGKCECGLVKRLEKSRLGE